MPITDGLNQALITACLNLLRAPATAALNVCDGVVPPNTHAPYVLIYSTTGRPYNAPSNATDGLARTITCRFIVHAVGDTSMSARAVAAQVETFWLNIRPVVAGLNCGLLRQESYQDPVRDETTGVLVMDSISTYTLTATT
jgi:hypothetical protein